MQNASIKSQKVNEIYKCQEVPDTYKIHKAPLHVFLYVVTAVGRNRLFYKPIYLQDIQGAAEMQPSVSLC